jgi:DNA polymerase beta
MTDIKQKFIDSLEILLKDRKANGEIWKARAYVTAIQKIKAHQGPIVNIDDIQQLKLGAGAIFNKAVEILNTGHVAEAEQVDQEQIKTNLTVDLFQGIACIGPVKANELVFVHKISTIEDLRNIATDVLNDKQQIGLRHYEDFQARIPRAEMEKHAAILATVIPREVNYEITGSFRRGEKTSGDIDVLISCDDIGADVLTNIVTRLTAQGYLYETLAKGEKKYMGVCKLKRFKKFRRFDLIFTTPKTYSFALLYFTGCASFNILMRNHALSRGWSLSEYGFKPTTPATESEVLPTFTTEQDVFDFLGLTYVDPTERTTVAKLTSV